MSSPARARLTARPGSAPTKRTDAGLHTIELPDARSALLYVPRASAPTMVPLVVSLHGAGGNARHGIDMLRAQADEHGFCILAPASAQSTWDVMAGGYGPDVLTLDRALAHTFANLHVRPEALAISGFSDGASYALSIGIANGELFRHILAFSPGFMAPPVEAGKPRVYMSHGTEDSVLPIDRCSRVIARRLRSSKYVLEYQEFDGPHTVPASVKEAAVRWWFAG